MQNKELTLRDQLAIDRTRLANQRTLLAMLRTALYLVLMSLTIWSLNALEDLRWVSGLVLIAGIVTGAIGLVLWNNQRKRILRAYK